MARRRISLRPPRSPRRGWYRRGSPDGRRCPRSGTPPPRRTAAAPTPRAPSRRAWRPRWPRGTRERISGPSPSRSSPRRSTRTRTATGKSDRAFGPPLLRPLQSRVHVEVPDVQYLGAEGGAYGDPLARHALRHHDEHPVALDGGDSLRSCRRGGGALPFCTFDHVIRDARSISSGGVSPMASRVLFERPENLAATTPLR